ncbi:MAG: hypothetical protein U0230_25035 [Polyangiales bacterium]
MRLLKVGVFVAVAAWAVGCDDGSGSPCEGAACDAGMSAQDSGSSGNDAGAATDAGSDGGTNTSDSGTSSGDGGSCVPSAGADLPDPSFLDTDCDGFDGTAADAVFVAPDGDDLAAGTPASPVRTVTRAYEIAASSSKAQIFVGTGTYDAGFTVTAGIHVYGGYQRINGWQRTRSQVSRFLTDGPALRATTVSVLTTLSFLTFESKDATVPGGSSIAAILDHSNGVRLEDCVIHAGAGAAGADYSQAARPAQGTAGGAGGVGRLMARNASAPAACMNSAPAGGTAGGAGDCAGGAGGAADSAPMTRDGSGFGGSQGQPGTQASCSTTSSGAAGTYGYHTFGLKVGGGTERRISMAGTAGVDGQPGGAGTNGAAVDRGVFGPSGYQPADGHDGIAGTRGGGGGGGGGGADQLGFSGTAVASASPSWSDAFAGGVLPNAAYDNCFVAGGGGGGGGQGGAAGIGGHGGGGGGASVALLLLDSTPTLVRVTISSGHGGAGGAGAAGSLGGLGGDPGPGGLAYTMTAGDRTLTGYGSTIHANSPEPLLATAGGPYNVGITLTGTQYVASGGNGGRGGNGGNGGAGAGGSGGPSVGILSSPGSGASASSSGVVFDTSRLLGGVAGPGGGNDNTGYAGYAGQTGNLAADGRIMP